MTVGRAGAAVSDGHRRQCVVIGGEAEAGECDRVENQHDLAVAQHRGAGIADQPGILRPGVLDDDFLVAAQRRSF